jgi:FMN phosphatase YigB (HAD superfamily)
MAKEIKAVGLDLDGTLYPSTDEIQGRIRGKIYEKLADHFGIPFDTAMALFEDGYDRLHSGSKTIAEISDKYGKPINGSEIVQDSLQEADILDLILPNPELVGMLERISQTKRLDLLTGSAYGFALKKLERLGVDPGVFSIFLADEHGSKSDLSLFSRWFEVTGLSSCEHFYVGDNKKQDIDNPKSLGVGTCIIGNYELADFRINNILELEGLLNSI